MSHNKSSKSIVIAKVLVLLGFLTLILTTYYLRGEVLTLSHIKFSADEVRSANSLKQLRDSYPSRVKSHEAAMKQYELRMKHYQKMLNLYQNDYDEYVKRIEDRYDLPPLPSSPVKPNPPELEEKLFEIDARFRSRKNQYFATSSQLVWVACLGAMMLSGGLVFLLMFDINGHRWYYLALLMISFVFLIGPAFHSIMSGIVGFLKGP